MHSSPIERGTTVTLLHTIKQGPSKVKHPARGHTAPKCAGRVALNTPSTSALISTFQDYLSGSFSLQMPALVEQRLYFCLGTLARHVTRQEGTGVSAQNPRTSQGGAQQSTGCSTAFCSSLNGKLASSLGFKQKETLLIKVTLKSVSLTSLMMAYADIMCLLT